MQAALIVDVLRSAGYLHKNGVDGAKMGPVMLMGHSMGAGISVATAAMLKNVAGVAAEAPAVRNVSHLLNARLVQIFSCAAFNASQDWRQGIHPSHDNISWEDCRGLSPMNCLPIRDSLHTP